MGPDPAAAISLPAGVGPHALRLAALTPRPRVNCAGVSACAGRLKLVALIQDVTVIQHILRHLGLPDVVPEMRPSRAPPCRLIRPTTAGLETTTEEGPLISAGRRCVERWREAVKYLWVGADARVPPGPECAPRGMP